MCIMLIHINIKSGWINLEMLDPQNESAVEFNFCVCELIPLLSKSIK